MKSFCQGDKGKNRFEQIFETIEIEYIALNEKEAAKRVCAVVRVLLEIDQILESRESEAVTQEAA